MKYIGALLPVLVLLSGLAFAPVVAAQDTTPAPEAATALEDVVVTARRSGAPMWEVRRGDSTVLLVGEIRGVPAATPWRPDALEAATLRADRVFSGMRVQASFSDLFRLIWRSRTFVSLPEGKTTADYLPPEWQVRLSALEVRYDQDYSRRSFLISSEDLLTDRLRFDRATTDDAGDVVKRAARRGHIKIRAVDAGRGDELIENLLTAAPETFVPCMEAAIAATEAGPESLVARGEAWTKFRVPAVLASPLERALGVCWPWGDPSLGPQLKAEWVKAVNAGLGETGVTMAVAPLGVLAEPGGVLDQLEAQGLEIDGPVWREDQR
jgi:hypothetical protein